MELVQCAPFIRFADTVCFTQRRGPSKTCDNRFIFALKGGARITLDGVEYALRPGGLVILRSGTEYRILPEPELTAAVLDFDYTQRYSDRTEILPPCPAEEFVPETAHEQALISDVSFLNRPFFVESVSFAEPILREIIEEFRERRVFFREKASALFLQLLFELVRNSQMGDDPRGVAERVLEYIDRNIGVSVTNRTIGQALGYNPNYLNRLMLRHTNMTLHQYVLRRRLTLATAMLISTDRPIGQIAAELGFHSASHFANFFKKSTGISPALCRKNGTL